MTLRFAASEVYSATYVIAAAPSQAEAWIRRQTRPAQFVATPPTEPGPADVVVLATTFTSAQRKVLELVAQSNGWRTRQVYA